MGQNFSNLRGVRLSAPHPSTGRTIAEFAHINSHQLTLTQVSQSKCPHTAVQQLAKWFHPEQFEALDPEATLEELHERFLPIDYQPGYWVTLQDE